MYQNPYAAPQPPDPYRTSTPVRGEPQPWDPSDALRVAWELFKGNWGPLVGAVVIMTFLGALPGQVPNVLAQTGAIDAQQMIFVSIPFSIVGWLVQEFFAAGLTRTVLDAGRTGTVQFSQLFSAGGNGRFLSFLALAFLKSFAIALGFVLFIVPGAILALGLSLSSYYVIDQGLGPIEAMKASWEATTGHKGQILVYFLLGILVALGGMIACCVGILPAAAIIELGYMVIYTRLSGTAAGPTAFGASPTGPWGPPPGPGGFGGPPPGGPGGFGGPPPGGGGYGPPPGGGGFGPPGGGGGYGPPPGF